MLASLYNPSQPCIVSARVSRNACISLASRIYRPTRSDIPVAVILRSRRRTWNFSLSASASLSNVVFPTELAPHRIVNEGGSSRVLRRAVTSAGRGKKHSEEDRGGLFPEKEYNNEGASCALRFSSSRRVFSSASRASVRDRRVSFGCGSNHKKNKLRRRK